MSIVWAKHNAREIHSSASIQDEESSYETEHYSYYNNNDSIYNDNDNEIVYEEEYDEQKEKNEHDDDLYSGEIGYWIVKLLRGNEQYNLSFIIIIINQSIGTTAGRQLKRNIAKFTVFQIAAGISFIIMAAVVDRNYNMSLTYTLSTYGLSLLNLTYIIAILTIFISVCSLLIIRYWASLCTNRTLLLEVVKIYVIVFIIIFGLLIWLYIALFSTYKRITTTEWTNVIRYTAIFPVYISTIIFGGPYAMALVLYCLDIWYLIKEIEENGADIDEPDAPDDVADLSDVSFSQALFFIFVIPFVLAIQFVDLISALCRACSRYRAYRKRKTERDQEISSKTKRRSVFDRIITTFTKKFQFSTVSPTEKYAADVQLKDMEKGREEIEQMERERAEYESSRRRNIEEQARLQDEEADKERRRVFEEEEATRRAEEQQRRDEEALDAYTLNLSQFKSKWKRLGTGGTFQCKLKALPSQTLLTEHLQKKGFHVVYSAGKSSDIEIGICNTKTTLEDGWFMARFLASPSSFSSVMKAENPDDIKIYVKLFELAKVIKIEIEKTE